MNELIVKYQKAADIHKEVRRYLNVNNIVKPGIKLIDLCNIIELKINELCKNEVDMINKQPKAKQIKGGIAFPTGLSINHIAAHYTPEFNTTEILGDNDVIKIDFGVHIDGCIIDSAFTYSANPIFKPLLDATREATYNAMTKCGVDARLGEIGKIVQEVIESYELNINNNIYPIKPIYNLGGHNILQYKLHGGKIVPLFYEEHNKEKMKSDEIYAIETFATTGTGYAQHSNYCSIYAKSGKKAPLNFKESKTILNDINRNYASLPFCTRDLNILSSNYGLAELTKKQLITPYPALVDSLNSYTSQLEHTIYISDKKTSFLSLANDY